MNSVYFHKEPLQRVVFAVALWAAGTATQVSHGAPVTDGGLGAVWPAGIEATQTLDTLSAESGNFGSTSGSNVNEGGASFIAAGIDTTHAVGTLHSALAGDLQLDLGNGASADTLRATVQMTLGNGMRLANVSGDDFWVTEGGGPNLPEAFMARVSTDNAATWSAWHYRFSEVQYNPDGNATIAFFTGFDFVNDFGLSASATVTHIELQNAIAAERVDNSSGEGAVVLGGGSGFLLNKGPQGANAGYASGNFDADIGYVFYAQSIPEPSAGMLMALGCLGLRRSNRRGR
jgi:hypothetical protein